MSVECPHSANHVGLHMLLTHHILHFACSYNNIDWIQLDTVYNTIMPPALLFYSTIS